MTVSERSLSAEKSPRSWFLSLTAIWQEASGWARLQSLIDASLIHQPLPVHHTLVPISSWHSTVFAIVEIRCKPKPSQTANDLATRLLQQLAKQDVVQQICNDFTPLTVSSWERKCFDDGTTIQFAHSQQLAKYRERVRAILKPGVEQILTQPSVDYELVSLLDNKWKSNGATFFGSIARSPSGLDSNFFRWSSMIEPVSLTFDSIHLLVSDDALTNPRQTGVTDLLVAPRHKPAS